MGYSVEGRVYRLFALLMVLFDFDSILTMCNFNQFSIFNWYVSIVKRGIRKCYTDFCALEIQ